MTQEEAKTLLIQTFCCGADIFDTIINNGHLKEQYIGDIKDSWANMAKYARGKSMKEYFKDQLKELLEALSGENTVPHADYYKESKNEEDMFADKLLKFLKKNYGKENIKPDDSYENIVKRMIKAI